MTVWAQCGLRRAADQGENSSEFKYLGEFCLLASDGVEFGVIARRKMDRQSRARIVEMQLLQSDEYDLPLANKLLLVALGGRDTGILASRVIPTIS